VPFVLCFAASIAAGAGALATQTLRSPAQSIFSSALRAWPLAFLALTLAVNAGCTGTHRFSPPCKPYLARHRL
jgi:hypothetical protein